MTGERDKGRNGLDMWIGGRSQTFPSRRSMIGNKERHVQEPLGMCILGVGKQSHLVSSFHCLREPIAEGLRAGLRTCFALVSQWVEKGVAK